MKAYWQQALSQLSIEQWESLCDGCGKCCLHKLQDEDSDEIFYTRVACRYLDAQRCQCQDYNGRLVNVPQCLDLRKDIATIAKWLPQTCAYRLRSEDKTLPSWHYLVSGSRESIHEAGMSVRGKTLNELEVCDEDFETHIVRWVD